MPQDAALASAGTHIFDLPEPLLLHVLSFLSDARSRHAASLACRRLCTLERATRASLSLRGDPRSSHFLLLHAAFAFPSLSHLDLSLISPWGHPFLSSSHASHSLSSHHLPDDLPLRHSLISRRLARCFPAVSSLSVYSRDPSTLAALAPHWKNSLRHVKLVRWHQRPPNLPLGADLAPLLESCGALASLDLAEFYCWTDDIAPALTAHPAAAASLTALDLGLANATDGFGPSELAAIAGACPKLWKLVAPCVFNRRYIEFVGDEALVSLATSCPLLTVLRLTEPAVPAASQEDDAAITVPGLVSVFSLLPGLEELALDIRQNVRDAGQALEALALKCPRIKFLKLGYFQGVCKAAWLHLDGIAVCGGLESLCIKNCGDLKNAGLEAIGRGCRMLAKFAIHDCGAITSAGIKKLADMRRSTLKDVSISGCRLLDTTGCLSALAPIRNRIERLEIDCVWAGACGVDAVAEPIDAPNGRGCEVDDDEFDDPSCESAPKKCRYMEELVGSWEQLRSLSLWLPAGEVLSPLIYAGLDSCPVLEEISIKVEGDCRTCPRPAAHMFGLSDLAGFPRLAKMRLDLGEAVGYALTAPTGQMDLSLWERFYLQGIESLPSLYELDYWPPQDKEVNQRSLTLPSVALLQHCTGLRKLFIHGTTHEHFMTFFQKMLNLRDVQLREDYYPAPENDMSTEMRAESWLRFEAALNNRNIPD